MRTITRIALALAGAVVAATWIGVAVQFDRNWLELLVFTAPGALVGEGVGWLAHASSRRAFTWRRGLIAAFLGAVILPPWFATSVAFAPAVTFGGALTVLVAGAWAAVLAGLLAALAIHVWWGVGELRERIHRRVRALRERRTRHGRARRRAHRSRRRAIRSRERRSSREIVRLSLRAWRTAAARRSRSTAVVSIPARASAARALSPIAPLTSRYTSRYSLSESSSTTATS
jgi:hypothetical protein